MEKGARDGLLSLFLVLGAFLPARVAEGERLPPAYPHMAGPRVHRDSQQWKQAEEERKKNTEEKRNRCRGGHPLAEPAGALKA